MKLKIMSDYLDFLKAVDGCAADVYFHSSEGDHLNLKSTFCQYLFASVCKDRAYLEGGSVECAEPGDYARLDAFLT